MVNNNLWSNVPQETIHIVFDFLPLRSIVQMMTVSKQFLSISAHFLLSTPIFLDETETFHGFMLVRDEEFDEGPHKQVHDGKNMFCDHPINNNNNNGNNSAMMNGSSSPLSPIASPITGGGDSSALENGQNAIVVVSGVGGRRYGLFNGRRRRQNVKMTQHDLCVLLNYTDRELNTIHIGKVFMKQNREEDRVRSDVLMGCIRRSCDHSAYLSALHLNCTGLRIGDVVPVLTRVVPRLHTLDLSDLELNYAHELISILGRCTPQLLKNLTLSNIYPFEKLSEMENSSYPHLFQHFLTVLYTLTSLSLKNCGQELLIHEKTNGTQTTIFDFCPFLEHLSIGDPCVTIDWNKALKKTIDERAKNLRSLHVKGGRITLTCRLFHDDISRIPVDLFPKLTSVVMDTNIGFFKSYVEHNTHIENFISDADVVQLLRKIKNLHITGVPNHQQTITAPVFEWILGHLPHTERLSITDFSEMTDRCISNNVLKLDSIKSLDLSTTMISDELLVLVVNNLPNLTSISACFAKNKPVSRFRQQAHLGGFLLSYTDAINLGLVLRKKETCKLSYINFSGSNISCFLIAYLLTASSSTLEHLLLKGSVGSDHAPHESGVSILEPLRALTRVNLAETNSSLCCFITEQLAIRTCPNLLSINISRIKSDNMCDLNNIKIGELLSSAPSLLSIKAENLTQLTDESMAIMANNCHRLTKLELSGTSITMDSLLGLDQLSQLMILKATGIEMPTTLDDVHALIHRLGNVRTLALNLHDCGMSNRTLECIVNNCQSIETLILGGRPLQHMGQFITKRIFLSFIVGLVNLEMLIMDFCPLLDIEAVEEVKQAVRSTGRPAPTLILPYVRTKRPLPPPKKEQNCRTM